MSDQAKGGRPPIGSWFVRKFFGSAPTWIGLTAGLATGAAFLDKGPLGGAIGFGTMVAICAGLGSLGILKAVRSIYEEAHREGEQDSGSEDSQDAVVAGLRAAGHGGDADVLEKLFSDRDAILRRCRNREAADDMDAEHTLELVEAIVASACSEAEELQDLLRRVDDPLLEAPARAGG